MKKSRKANKGKVKSAPVKSPNNNEICETSRKDIDTDISDSWNNIELLTAAIYGNQHEYPYGLRFLSRRQRPEASRPGELQKN